ncbi:hypothetical protein HZS_422 [Henneguya salminicola]|nr:hypothetical protein HZS_422 [Henneguya salminicola]
MKKYCIIVHGGACAAPEITNNSKTKETYKRSIIKMAQIGYKLLENGATAVDAVEASIRALEDDELYNAGTGCCLTSCGTVELDALIMDGSTMNMGCVGCIDCTDHPISLARLIMEKSPHCLMVGNGVRLFAESQGAELLDSPKPLITQKAIESLTNFKDFNTALQKHMNVTGTSGNGCDTVGAVAMDSNGNIACGTSTGGITGKLPGRIGDAPLVGCGGYANNFGAASCTGHGESLMKHLCCKNVTIEIEKGSHPQLAARCVMSKIYDATKSCGGVICVNNEGEIGVYHSAEFMPWASMHSHEGLKSFFDQLF